MNQMARAPTKEATAAVLVARNAAMALTVTVRPAAIVVPDLDNWNDFGLRFYADLFILTENNTLKLPLRLMPLGENSTSVWLLRLLEERGNIFALGDIDHLFCSMQSLDTDYEAIVSLLGFDEAVGVLRSLHDVVLALTEGEDEEIIAMTYTEGFHVGMIRREQRYTAFRRGRRYLRPLPPRKLRTPADRLASPPRDPPSPPVSRFTSTSRTTPSLRIGPPS